MGSSDRRGVMPRSQRSSTGHMVVRPGVAGRTRRPAWAKKMALMSSDLPRDTSATKATTSLSLAMRSLRAASRSISASSSNSSSASARDRLPMWRPKVARQRASASRLSEMGLCIVFWRDRLENDASPGPRGRDTRGPRRVVGCHAAGRDVAVSASGRRSRSRWNAGPARPVSRRSHSDRRRVRPFRRPQPRPGRRRWRHAHR